MGGEVGGGGEVRDKGEGGGGVRDKEALIHSS